MNAHTDRLFLGVPLPPPLMQALSARLREVLPGGRLPGRPVPPANWHFTLRFLGDTPEPQRVALSQALSTTPLGAPFPVRLGTMGAFPRPARASVLWVGLREGDQPFRALAETVGRAVERAGFPPETRAFTPHLTLSRIPRAEDVRPLLSAAGTLDGGFRVEEVVLFRSHLGGGPARYEALERFPLA